MTPAPQKHTAALVAAVSVACLGATGGGIAQAGTWGTEPTVALSADYSSNPLMRLTGIQAAEAAVVTLDLPATYRGAKATIDLRPSFRTSATHGDPGLISDFQNLDGSVSLVGERDTLQARAGWHRDSTFYNQLENTALLTTSLRRREQSAQLSWSRSLTERNQVSLSASWDQVDYAQSYRSGLYNYTYPSISLQFSRALSERTKWNLATGSSRYDLGDQGYRTDNQFVSTGLVAQLSEAWSLTGTFGASTQQPRYQFRSFVFRPPSRNTTTYSLEIARQDDTRAMSLSYSRSLQPSGYGDLVTQDTLTLTRHFSWTERWSGAASLRGTRQLGSLGRLAFGDRKYLAADIAARWLWTRQWAISLEAVYNQQKLDQQLPQASSTTVLLTLTGQIGRRTIQ